MAPQFISEDDAFFGEFNSAIGLAATMAKALRVAVMVDPIEPALWPRIKALQDEAEVVVQRIHGHLDRAFITPIEREDIHLLGVTIVDVVDTIAAAVARLEVYGIERPTEPLRWFCAALEEMVDQLVIAVRDLRTLRPAVIRDATDRVEQVAVRVDDVVREVLRDLMAPGRPPYDLLRWKDVYDTFDTVADHARAVARTVRHVLVRHA